MRTFTKLTKNSLFLTIFLATLFVLGAVVITALTSDKEFVAMLLSETKGADVQETLSQLSNYESLDPEEAFQLRMEQLRAQEDSGDADA